MREGRVLIRAGQLADGSDGVRSPGAVLLEGGRILAAGSPESVGLAGGARVLDLPGSVVIPALVNAHAHLDLSHLDPAPYGGDFFAWLDGVRRRRAAGVDGVAAAVRRGLLLAAAGGTAAVGDVAGGSSRVPHREMGAGGMAGVSYLEVIGAGGREGKAAAQVGRLGLGDHPSARPGGAWRASGLRLGIFPHAPYTCGPSVYRAAAALGIPMATHAAESLDEERYMASGNGPLADFLRGFGMDCVPGCHPVDYLAEFLATRPAAVAHANYVEDRHLEDFARWRTTIVYCPRASAYFGHPAFGRPPHAYRRMLAAGVNVALGTDGLLCLDTPDRISVLDEMRLLYRRDGTDPRLLLRMATIGGAIALGLEPGPVTLRPGPTAGLLALPFDPSDRRDPMEQVLLRNDPPRWISPGPRDSYGQPMPPGSGV